MFKGDLNCSKALKPCKQRQTAMSLIQVYFTEYLINILKLSIFPCYIFCDHLYCLDAKPAQGAIQITLS